MTQEHERYMARCIELARLAKSRGDTPVGSVVVRDGEIIGEGSESLPAGHLVVGHAEVLACQQAVDRWGRPDRSGADLYTTAEPCFMCSYVIRNARISRVVYGLATPWIGGVTSRHPILVDPSLASWRPAPEVVAGILADECRRLRPQLAGGEK